MTARLGNVAYWIATAIAGLLALASLAGLFGDGGLGDTFVFIVLAGLVWLLGRVIRYVLASK